MMQSPSTIASIIPPKPVQTFGTTQVSMRKESKSIGGQYQHVMADTGDFTTPTWEELSDEQCKGYEVFRRKRKEEFEVLKKKREEEEVQMFYAMKKDPTLTPYRNNHVQPSVLERQEDETL